MNMAPRRLIEADHVSTCATTLPSFQRLTTRQLRILLLLRDIMGKARPRLGLDGKGWLL